MEKIVMMGLAAAMSLGAMAEEKHTLFLVGDSTLEVVGEAERKRCPGFADGSWGYMLRHDVKAEWQVVDNAYSGQSVKSTLMEIGGRPSRWSKTINAVKPGDWVIIAFGHNDQKTRPESQKLHTSMPEGIYREGMTRMVKEVEAKGGKVVLCSPIRRGSYGRDGKLYEWTPAGGRPLSDYAAETKRIAAELGADYVDMYELTRIELERVGKEEGLRYFRISTGKAYAKDGESSTDVTHPVAYGARKFADVFLKEVRGRKLAITGIFK